MNALLHGVAGFLLVVLFTGLLRIWWGPNAADRMLASQLFGTTGVALVLVLAETQDMPALRDVALTLALLAVLATVAFVTRWVRIDRDPPVTGKQGESSDA
ncbi:monovalent cation/H+ antiporter complex subunit F [Kineobactrum salinum]|uniref:pH regulation protein F n=1 Tax=Kineobactrum salinum TaxID=2708301 RepID=A0A6C0U222_9GAMM|nr:monovalent cation/H+ antiporter complex subunit F [Kineobactrum salinum]QIB65037.1 pH regulation protein F [Kineobactrum salinum]